MTGKRIAVRLFVVGCVVTSAAALVRRAVPPTSGREDERHLIEVQSILVPDSIDLIGVTGSLDGRIAAWTDDAVYEVVRRVFQPVTSNIRPLAVAEEDDEWETVDLNGMVIARHHAGNSLPTQLPFTIQPLAAAKLECGWVFQLFDQQIGVGSLALINDAGQIVWHKQVPWIKGVEGESRHLTHLASNRRLVTITSLQYPFETAVINCAGDLRNLAPSPQYPSDHGWIALATVPIKGGYLTTLSHIASDQRVIRRRDLAGNVIKDTNVDVPLGLASSLGLRRVLAVRRTDRVEIVVYDVR